MEQKNNTVLLTVAVTTAVLSFLICGMIFGASQKIKVPTVETITTTFPDINNDSAYNTIFNQNSLDAAQPVIVGNSQNNQPFSGSR